ncbi:MAG: family 1 glycosylhydrolase [Anaerolineae bacterium]|nr:family 1 glycosylhydrolase [Anaerolineae bacterium]
MCSPAITPPSPRRPTSWASTTTIASSCAARRWPRPTTCRRLSSPRRAIPTIGPRWAWETYPDGLFATLARVAFEYQAPRIYITENGASYADGPDADGRVHDARRLAYVRQHLVAAWRAIQAGVPLAGYFAWSLLDNFEWARGYAQRFGLTWVNYETQERIVKDSGLWYGQAARAGGFAPA